MIAAYAYIHCDAPGCRAAFALAEPLRFGQLNPLQCQELRETAGSAGWGADWGGYRDGVPTALHYCPEHTVVGVSRG